MGLRNRDSDPALRLDKAEIDGPGLQTLVPASAFGLWCLWANHFISACRSVLICKMRTKIPAFARSSGPNVTTFVETLSIVLRMW